jgi:hypothetical protein
MKESDTNNNHVYPQQLTFRAIFSCTINEDKFQKLAVSSAVMD